MNFYGSAETAIGPLQRLSISFWRFYSLRFKGNERVVAVPFQTLLKINQLASNNRGSKWDVLAYFPNTVAAIDCTEIFTEKPRKLSTQKAKFSSYKNHTTVKYLAAIDLYTGSFVYMSSGFPSCTSDRKTVEKSGLLEQLIRQEELYSRKLASARVHVERAFGHLREFHYINRRQSNSATQGTLDQIMMITAALVNLQVRLIGERH